MVYTCVLSVHVLFLRMCVLRVRVRVRVRVCAMCFDMREFVF